MRHNHYEQQHNTLTPFPLVYCTMHPIIGRTATSVEQGVIKERLLRNIRYLMLLTRSMFCIHLAVATSAKRQEGE